MHRRGLSCLTLILIGSLFLAGANGQSLDDELTRAFRAGQLALRQGQFAEAAEDFKKVLHLEPGLMEAEVNLGLAYQGSLEYESAAHYLSKALRERPNLLGPNLIVGKDYLKLGSPEKAIPYLQAALKIDPSNLDARQGLASCYLAEENYGSAADQFRQIASIDPDKAAAWFKLGHEYLDLAARLAYRGARLYRDSAWGHRFLGDLLYERQLWNDAIVEYQKAAAGDPQQAGLHTAIGQAYLQMGKVEQAETEFRSELRLDSKHEAAWLGLANIELLRNHQAAAIEDARKAREISPEFLAMQRDFPWVHPTIPAMVEWKEFQQQYSVWQQEIPTRGTASSDGQEPCKAHQYAGCVSSLELRKHLTEPERLSLGKARLILQRYVPAADVLSQVHGTAAENAEASYWLEKAYQSLGAETYARLEESYPDSWHTYRLRAEGSALRGNWENAFEEFRVALAQHPNEPELHEAVGELYLDTSDLDSAQIELEKALAIDRLRTHALYLLGRVYVLKKENEKAVPYLEQALQLEPDLPEANSLLGTAYLRLGRVENAVAKLEKAAPSDHYGNVHYQLAVAYRKLGQTDRAKKELLLWRDVRRNSAEREEALVMRSAPPPVIDGLDAK